jgi:hypothetical protein
MPDFKETEIIIPLPQKLNAPTQQQLERLQNHSIVELEMV